MKGLILKDFYMIKGYCRSFMLILAVFLCVSFASDNNTFFIIYPAMLAGLIPVTLISYDEREHWNEYSAVMPYTKAQIVSSKYIVGLILETAISLIAITAQFVRMNIAGTYSLSTLFSFACGLLLIGFIGPSLLLPFIFRFGAEKGRIAYYVVLCGICAATTFLSGSSINIAEKLNSTGFMLLIMLLVPVIYGCSWALSVKLYKKREL